MSLGGWRQAAIGHHQSCDTAEIDTHIPENRQLSFPCTSRDIHHWYGTDMQ